MNRNGNHHSVALLDVVENETPETQTGPFYDSDNPVLKPAKAVDAGKRKSWKRKLIGWCFILLLIGGGAVALYLLLRVNRVPVRVQADSRRDPQNAKSKNDANNSENGLTSDAINIARAAAGTDTATANHSNPASSPNPSPVPSPTLTLSNGRNLSFTGNLSPVNETLNDALNATPTTTQRQNQHPENAFFKTETTQAPSTQRKIFFNGGPPKLLPQSAPPYLRPRP